MSVTTMTLLLYGDAKTGKSTLADTAPGPRLIIDTENGTDWTSSNKVYWNPLTEDIPKVGEDDSVIVKLKDEKAIDTIMQWLRSGRHPFNSVIVDSLMELQKRILSTITHNGQPTFHHFGDLLRKMEAFCSELRDLTMANGESLPCVVIVSGAETNEETGKVQPFLKGGLRKSIPYIFDIVGYLKVGELEGGGTERRLAIAPIGKIIAGSRIPILEEKYGDYIANPNLTTIYKILEEARDTTQR